MPADGRGMRCTVVHVSEAIASLRLPPHLERRLSRALDLYVRHRRSDTQTVRAALSEAVAVLSLGNNADAAIEIVADAVAAHAREIGVRKSSILGAVPVDGLLAAEVREWAAHAISARDDSSTSPVIPRTRMSRWERHARSLCPAGDAPR